MIQFGVYYEEGKEPVIFEFSNMLPVRGEYVTAQPKYGDRDYEKISKENLVMIMTVHGPKSGYTIQEVTSAPVLSTQPDAEGVFYYDRETEYCQYYYFHFQNAE